MIKASLTIKSPIRTCIRKIWLRDENEIHLLKGVIRRIENSEVTDVVITARK